jgi:predicted nuclease with TOPRIM domain
MIELTQHTRLAHPVANIASTVRSDNKTQSALPPCAKKQMLVPKTLEFDLHRIACDAQTDDSDAQEYMPFAEVQSMGVSAALNQILDSVLQDHADLLSDNAKTAIQPGGAIRGYLLQKISNASTDRGEALFAVFNQFLGASVKLKNTSLSKSSLESILALPDSELNCLAGMYERISMASRNISSASSLPKRLHLCVVDKLFSRIEMQSPHLLIGNQVHRRWNANSYEFLSNHQSEYQTLMLNEINQLISEEIEPVLQSIENAVYQQGAKDPYSLLKQMGEDKADVVGLFHPHVPETESNQSTSSDDAGQGLFHETRAYFGDPDEDTFLPVRLNRDQIYSNLFSRLRNHIEPVSKVAVVLSNPECAVGLARGIFNSAEKSLLNLTDTELSLSNNDDFVTAERNNALIEKVRARLPIYLEAKSGSLDLLLENNLIDVKSMLQSPFFKQSLKELLVLPLLEKQKSIAPGSGPGAQIQVTNYAKKIDPAKSKLLADVAIKFYARAITQGLGPAERIQLKNNIMTECKGVEDWTELNKLENTCQQAEAAKRGNIEVVGAVRKYLLDNNFPDGQVFTALKGHLESVWTQAIKTAKIEVLIDTFASNKDVLSPVDFTDASCGLLERLGELAHTKANNQMVCQALDAIQFYYFKGPGTATPDLTLKVMATMAQNMGKFRAAKLLSSPQTIASGGLARSQDPQTKAYKLIKQYLVKQTDDTGQLKIEFLKSLWASDAIGQFSDASRSLSARHWKKIITSVAGNAVLYGSGIAGLDHLADQMVDLANQIDIPELKVNIQEVQANIQELKANIQEVKANLSKAESDFAQLEELRDKAQADIQSNEHQIDELGYDLENKYDACVDLREEYFNNGKVAAYEEFMQAVYPDFKSGDSLILTYITREETGGWNEDVRSSLSPDAQQAYDDFFQLREEVLGARKSLDDASNLRPALLAKLSELDDQVLQNRTDLMDLRDQSEQDLTELDAQVLQKEQDLKQLREQSEQLERQNQVNQLSKAMPALAEGAAMVGRGAVNAVGRVASTVAKEANSWGPIGAKKTLQTAYAITQKNPLASVRDASVLLTPAAIEQFVIQSKKENGANNYLEDASGAWKQVLSRLDSNSIGLRDEQKAGLVTSFVKQFAVAGKFGLEKEKSREMTYSVLDSLESTNALKNLLPDIRKQSRSASETVMQYLLDKHDVALENNRPNDRLATQEIQRFSQVLGIKPKLQPVHVLDQSRISAVKLGQAVRPAWANTATLAAAITRRPMNEVINQVKVDRELQLQKMQSKLDASKALYQRMNRPENGDTPT